MKIASRETKGTDFVIDTLNNPDARTNYETKLVYSVPLYTGGKIKYGKKMAKLQILAKKAKYNYDEKALGLEVLKAYNGAVASKEFIKATIKAKKATSSFVSFANALFNEGLVTSIDVKQSLVYDFGVDSKMIEAKNRFALAISYLKFLTSDNTITDVNSFEEVSIHTLSLETLQKEAYQSREDLKSMKHNTDTMKTKIALDSADLYPTIGVHIEGGNNDDKFNGFDGKHDYYLGAIGLSYTLFDGGISSINRQTAKIEYLKTKHYFNYMKNGIALEVEKNILTLESKRKVLIQKTKAQNLSDEVLKQSQEMYKNHLINMSNLLLQQANHQKSNAETIMAKYEETLASAILKISLGKTLINLEGLNNEK